MTEKFKTISGTWSLQAGVFFRGLVDASLSARCLTGSEVDENYEFYATAKIAAGKAAIIANFTYSVDWEERYLEIVLDPTGDTVKLDAVIRNPNGTEKSRETLASRNMALAAATEYRLRLCSKKLNDAYAVYGFINDFLVVEAEDLAGDFRRGMCGLECLGIAGEYSEYKDILRVRISYGDACDVKSRLGIVVGDTRRDAEIAKALEYADDVVDDRFDEVDESVPTSVPNILKQAAADIAAGYCMRNKNPAIADSFENRGLGKVDRYIENRYKGEMHTE